MAAWLKVAEDLFEVVDRRAKLVASELVEDQISSGPSASNGHVLPKRTRSKEKDQPKSSSPDTYNSVSLEQEEQNFLTFEASIEAEKKDNFMDRKLSETNISGEATASCSELLSDANKEIQVDDMLPAISQTDQYTPDVDSIGVRPIVEDQLTASSSVSDSVTISNSEDTTALSLTSSLLAKEVESSKGDIVNCSNTKVIVVGEHGFLKNEQEKPETQEPERLSLNAQENDSNNLQVSSPNTEKQKGVKSAYSKVEDHLDEAMGLLKTTISTGQSKEARLARVCAGLSSRLQEYKSENAQLEELLLAERELCRSYESHIKQMQQELSASKAEVRKIESNMSGGLAAKNSEIGLLVSSMDALKKQSATSDGKLASLQAEMEEVMRSHELTETRMMQALREELASAERRAEEERVAHSAAKMAAVEREIELEHRAVEASNALARMQRTADESTSRSAELEHKVAFLEVECEALTQKLQDMEACNRRGKKKSAEEANQILKMQVWQEGAERARQGQIDAESKISSLEAELQKMRVEMEGMKRDAEHYSRHEHLELEKRYRGLTDLLYHKQTQLETIASQKAAAEFQLEKEPRHVQEMQVAETDRRKVSRRAPTMWEEDTDIKALEPLPLHHKHMTVANRQLLKAARLLDSGAVRATRFLCRYPTARVILLFYLVFVHLFLMYLLHRLQAQADNYASREIAASMGLSNNSSLP